MSRASRPRMDGSKSWLRASRRMASRLTRPTSNRRSRGGMSSDGAFLETAAAIGRRIVADAVWQDGLCSWVGAVANPPIAQRMEYRALGPDLYGGTAGVGLFLARLGDVMGDTPVRRTAVAAMRHAAARAGSIPLSRRGGFHSGAFGIAWAAARAAELLGNDELHASARGVVTEAGRSIERDPCSDIAMGSAGSIVGLLALAAELDEPKLIQEALATGNTLLERATVTQYGWSWPNPVRRWPHHICGVSWCGGYRLGVARALRRNSG